MLTLISYSLFSSFIYQLHSLLKMIKEIKVPTYAQVPTTYISHSKKHLFCREGTLAIEGAQFQNSPTFQILKKMETPIYWNLIYEHIKVRFLPSKKVDFYHFQGWPFKWHLMKNLFDLNPLSANPIKWPSTLKQFVGNLLTN